MEQLNRLAKGNDRVSADAREAIIWLDAVTEETGLVQLQGTDEVYLNWAEVERFMLPQTLLSMESEEHDVDSVAEDLDSTLHMEDGLDKMSMSSSGSLERQPKTPSSPRSAYSSTSPGLLDASPYKAVTSAQPVTSGRSTPRTTTGHTEGREPQNQSQSVVPPSLRPLFNHILWRIHQEQNTDAALESYILLTNDPVKMVIAQRFGVRAKRLEQLRDVIAREERDCRNRLLVHKKEMEADNKTPATLLPHNQLPQRALEQADEAKENQETDDEDEVVLKGPPRGPAAVTPQRVFDPNAFTRATPAAGSRDSRSSSGSLRGSHLAGSGRSGLNCSIVRNTPNGFVGRGSTIGSVGRGVSQSIAGRGGSLRGRGAFTAPTVSRQDVRDLDKPIDPDSFARPPPGQRSRGGGRRLWIPT